MSWAAVKLTVVTGGNQPTDSYITNKRVVEETFDRRISRFLVASFAYPWRCGKIFLLLVSPA